MKRKVATINTDSNDDLLYIRLIHLLEQIKLIRGGNELAFTLRNHPIIRDYLSSKQLTRLYYFEDHYFNPDGSLNSDSISELRSHSLKIH